MNGIAEFHKMLKNNRLYYLFILLTSSFFSVHIASAQDIFSEARSGEFRVFEGKKVSRVKAPIVKTKTYAVVAIKKNTQKPQIKAARPKIETISESKNESENKIASRISDDYPTTFVNGTVRLKENNQGAAGVLVEAVRIDTREMIDSAETGDTGEFKFKKLPIGTAMIFLVSSSKIKPYIFKINIETGMKDLEFTVAPQ